MTSKFYTLKHAFLFLVLIVPGIELVNAQSQQEELDLYQAVFGMEKKALVAGFINVTEDAGFWKLYDAYELERKELGKKRLSLLNNYAKNYENMTSDKADILIKDMQAQKKALDKLIDTYYKKIKKDSGSEVAAQFYQLENYILSVVRTAVLSEIPFIGEFEN